MKISKYKQLIVGIFIGTIITISASVFAETKSIEATFKGISITIDGKKIENMDVEPFICRGRTFVPVRYIAEKLGVKVAWNEDTKTVEFTTIKQ